MSLWLFSITRQLFLKSLMTSRACAFSPIKKRSELRTENDYAGPQPCLEGRPKFEGLNYPTNLPLQVSGMVAIVAEN